MAEEKELTGWERSRAAQKGYGPFYAGMAIATVFIAGVWIGSRIFATTADPDSSAFFLNMWTEALGILVTVGLFGLISKHLADERDKKELVVDLGSSSREVASNAAYRIIRRGWHNGDRSILRNADLSASCLDAALFFRANFQGAWFVEAKLRKIILNGANLRNCILLAADLTGAQLIQANLAGAKLGHSHLDDAFLLDADLENSDLFCANLKNVKLQQANLQNANLEAAILRGANLSGANMRGARLELAVIDTTTEFDSGTILPDGSNWSSDRDMEQFTNRNHPRFDGYYTGSK